MDNYSMRVISPSDFEACRGPFRIHVPIKMPGRWNSIHARIAWEIYHHQQKEQGAVEGVQGESGKASFRPPWNPIGIPGVAQPGGVPGPPHPLGTLKVYSSCQLKMPQSIRFDSSHQPVMIRRDKRKQKVMFSPEQPLPKRRRQMTKTLVEVNAEPDEDDDVVTSVSRNVPAASARISTLPLAARGDEASPPGVQIFSVRTKVDSWLEEISAPISPTVFSDAGTASAAAYEKAQMAKKAYEKSFGKRNAPTDAALTLASKGKLVQKQIPTPNLKAGISDSGVVSAEPSEKTKTAELLPAGGQNECGKFVPPKPLGADVAVAGPSGAGRTRKAAQPKAAPVPSGDQSPGWSRVQKANKELTKGQQKLNTLDVSGGEQNKSFCAVAKIRNLSAEKSSDANAGNDLQAGRCLRASKRQCEKRATAYAEKSTARKKRNAKSEHTVGDEEGILPDVITSVVQQLMDVDAQRKKPDCHEDEAGGLETDVGEKVPEAEPYFSRAFNSSSNSAGFRVAGCSVSKKAKPDKVGPIDEASEKNAAYKIEETGGTAQSFEVQPAALNISDVPSVPNEECRGFSEPESAEIPPFYKTVDVEGGIVSDVRLIHPATKAAAVASGKSEELLPKCIIAGGLSRTSLTKGKDLAVAGRRSKKTAKKKIQPSRGLKTFSLEFDTQDLASLTINDDSFDKMMEKMASKSAAETVLDVLSNLTNCCAIPKSRGTPPRDKNATQEISNTTNFDADSVDQEIRASIKKYLQMPYEIGKSVPVDIKQFDVLRLRHFVCAYLGPLDSVVLPNGKKHSGRRILMELSLPQVHEVQLCVAGKGRDASKPCECFCYCGNGDATAAYGPGTVCVREMGGISSSDDEDEIEAPAPANKEQPSAAAGAEVASVSCRRTRKSGAAMPQASCTGNVPMTRIVPENDNNSEDEPDTSMMAFKGTQTCADAALTVSEHGNNLDGTMDLCTVAEKGNQASLPAEGEKKSAKSTSQIVETLEAPADDSTARKKTRSDLAQKKQSKLNSSPSVPQPTEEQEGSSYESAVEEMEDVIPLPSINSRRVKSQSLEGTSLQTAVDVGGGGDGAAVAAMGNLPEAVKAGKNGASGSLAKNISNARVKGNILAVPKTKPKRAKAKKVAVRKNSKKLVGETKTTNKRPIADSDCDLFTQDTYDSNPSKNAPVKEAASFSKLSVDLGAGGDGPGVSGAGTSRQGIAFGMVGPSDSSQNFSNREKKSKLPAVNQKTSVKVTRCKGNEAPANVKVAGKPAESTQNDKEESGTDEDYEYVPDTYVPDPFPKASRFAQSKATVGGADSVGEIAKLSNSSLGKIVKETCPKRRNKPTDRTLAETFVPKLTDPQHSSVHEKDIVVVNDSSGHEQSKKRFKRIKIVPVSSESEPEDANIDVLSDDDLPNRMSDNETDSLECLLNTHCRQIVNRKTDAGNAQEVSTKRKRISNQNANQSFSKRIEKQPGMAQGFTESQSTGKLGDATLVDNDVTHFDMDSAAYEEYHQPQAAEDEDIDSDDNLIEPTPQKTFLLPQNITRAPVRTRTLPLPPESVFDCSDVGVDEVNVTAAEDTHILASNLGREDAKLLCQMIAKVGANQDAHITAKTTHLVAASNAEGVAPRTAKFICALASGAWVVSMDWVLECLAKRTLVDPGRYELNDTAFADSPRRSRLGGGHVLQDFAVYLIRPYRGEIEASTFELMLKLAGAEVSISPTQDVMSGKKYFLALAELEDSYEQKIKNEEYLSTHKALTVGYTWIHTTICSFSLLPIWKHMPTGINIPPAIRKCYPESMFAPVPEEDDSDASE